MKFKFIKGAYINCKYIIMSSLPVQCIPFHQYQTIAPILNHSPIQWELCTDSSSDENYTISSGSDSDEVYTISSESDTEEMDVEY